MAKKFIKVKKSNINTLSNGKNDVTWYAQNPLLMRIAGLINCFRALGSKVLNLLLGKSQDIVLKTKQTSAAWAQNLFNFITFPGVLKIGFIPTPGVSRDPESPVNKCAIKYFNSLRLKNVSISAYDPSDVMFYFLLCDSLFSLYAYLVLVYTHAKKFAFTNKYLPKAILRALNVDYDDIVDNLSQLLFEIERFKEFIKLLRVPKKLHYIARHMHMCANVYKDSENEKAQLFVFVPEYLLQYDASVPELKPIPIGANPTLLKFTDLKNLISTMSQALIPDEDMGIIAADIQKFIDTDYWTVNSIDWTSDQDPVYSPEMNWQLHNANYLPYTSVTGINITQQTDSNLNTYIVWNPEFTSSETGVQLRRIFDSDKAVPDAKEVVENTRLMFVIDNYERTGLNACKFKLKSCGSEIVVGSKIIIFDESGNLTDKTFSQFVHMTSDLTNNRVSFAADPSNANCMIGVDLFSLSVAPFFNFKPILYLVDQRTYKNNPDDWETILTAVVGQVDNYAVLDDIQIEDLNEQCLLSMLNLGD